jgi:hypothetical protein
MISAAIIFCVILLVGFGLFYLALKLAEKAMNRRVNVGVILRDFKKKMWMTVGLGALFFGSYLLLVFIASLLINSKTRLDIFFFLHEHAIASIYLGLLIFATISVSIYLVRLWIKYLYNKRHRQ